MVQDTFQTIADEGRLLYLAVAGSTSQGINIEGVSDTDYIGVYIAREENVLGLPQYFVDQVSDARHDTTWYEIGKFMSMLIKSNPTVLSALFVDDKFVKYEHPLFTDIKKHRQEFVTKDCFGAFIGYSISQIKKARGLNKKIVEKPITEHSKPLDFCYTFFKQGSTKIENWLEHRGLFQKYCGLVNIPNMHNCYGVYYDFGAHKEDNPNWDRDKAFYNFVTEYISKCVSMPNGVGYYNTHEWMEKQVPQHYRGIVGEEDDIYIENFVGKPKIFDVRLSSVEKGALPICTMLYNQSGYSSSCREFKEYQEWVANRNPQRFKENQEKEFDRKNIAHCVRLLHMGIEIAKTGIVRVNRMGIDRDFILNIRLGNTKYDEIMSYIESKNDEMQQAMAESTLPEHVNADMVNSILVNLRHEFYKTL